MVLGLILYPKQYSVPDPKAFADSDSKRDNIYQQLILNKTKNEMDEKIQSNYSRVNVVTKEEQQQRQERINRYNEEFSRDRGNSIIKDRKLHGMESDGRVTSDSVKSETSKRATAISKWMKLNVKQ